MILLVTPFFLFAVFRTLPVFSAFGPYVNVPDLLQYYASTLAGLLAVIIALLTRHGLGLSLNGRSVLITFGFLTLAALLLVSSLGIPYLLLQQSLHPVFIWSLFLSLPLSSIYFIGGSVRWTAVAEKRIIAWRWPLLGINLIGFLLYLVITVALTTMLAHLPARFPAILFFFAALSITWLLWAAWRAYGISQAETNSNERNLAVTFLLLAQAELCLAFGRPGSLNWFLYQVLLLTGLAITLLPLLKHAIHYQREKRQRSELAQLIVHDLKSPLTIVTSGLELLHRGNLGPLGETQQKLINDLQHCGSEVLNLVEDMLDVERLEEGVMPLHKRLMDLTPLLREQTAELQILANKHDQCLTIITPESLPLVLVDPHLARRVVHNLVANALKFTPDGGEITVQASGEKNTLVVTVADSGPGIPPPERQRIFEKFTQLDTHNRRGKGLGLTFCKMAVEAHGGILSAEDSPLGGAMFRMTLPSEEPTPPATAAKAERKPRFYRLIMGK